MKKISIFFLIIGITFLISCKKDYTCACKIGSDTELYILKDKNKLDAKDECSAINSLGTYESCSLEKNN